jgi:adenylate cyclase
MSRMHKNLTHPAHASVATEVIRARPLLLNLVWLYVQGSLAAVVVTLLLVYLGLEFSARQWLLLLLGMPVGVTAYMVLDIYLIVRHFRPIATVLSQIDGDQPIAPADVSAALVRALNLPFYSFIRVTFVHGPAATLVTVAILWGSSLFFDGGFALWQIVAFAATVLCFAAPTHAILEYFSISRRMIPVLVKLWEHGAVIDQTNAKQLIRVNLREKLLYLSIFIAAVPLVFFAVSIVFKVDLLLIDFGINATAEQMLPLWLWLAGVVLVCMIGALVMSILTASDVSRSAAHLNAGMTDVERGDLNKHLYVINTDEYASLYRGFNLMTASLREEVRFLEVTQEIAGELNLDVLLSRIMRAAVELLGAERSTVFAFDLKTNELWSRFAQGIDIKEIRIPANEGIAGAVFTSGQAQNISDPYSHPLFNPEIDRKTQFKTRNILCMPITNKAGHCLGVTQVLNKFGGVFTSKDEARLRAFTAQIAVSIENAQLFEEVLNMKNYNESVLKSISNGIITLDSDGRVVTANAAARSIVGVGDSEQDIADSLGPVLGERNQWLMRSLAKVRATGESDMSVDAALMLADGVASASVNLMVTPLNDGSENSLGSMVVLEDISSEKRVKTTMARYMSAEVVDQLLKGGEDELGGKNQHVSVLFSDVRSFTTISEAIGARETVSMLNEYFEVMVDVLFKHDGILDKYIGDAIMALFGVPFNGPQDADNAVIVATEMMTELELLNQRRAQRGGDAIGIGLGIATGEVVVGNIGSPKRMEYTVIGDSVNLAARLEGATKFYGVKILLSGSTVAELKHDALLREIDLLRVKGKELPVTIYEGLGYYNDSSFPDLHKFVATYNEGLQLYRAQDWRRAVDCFEGLLNTRAHDRPAQIYLERAQHYSDNPPASGWDGVWVMTEK